MKTWKFLITLMMTAAVLAGAAYAAPAHLSSITAGVQNPVRVAVDSQGNLYVAEASENKIVKFNPAGKNVGTLSVTYPLSVAVDTAGNIYAGCVVSSKKQGLKNVVVVYDANFSQIGSLGIGAGEFTFPVDVTVDGSGKIYVVDKDAHTVSVYDQTTRARVLSFGGFGNGNGQLSRPTSVAVNDATGEIFVADAPQTSTPNGLTTGARISVFDRNGSFVRSFGEFGFGSGQITSPEDMAIDSAGQLYVVDAYQGAALILNAASGSSVGAGALYDNANPMFNPSGIAISQNGLVYIASKMDAGSLKGKIETYALDGYVTMEVTPSSLVYAAAQMSGNPAAQTVVIANAGSGTVNWTANADKPWLKIAQGSGAVGPKSSAGLPVSVDISTLSLGSYNGTVTIDSGFGEKQTVSVALSVIQPPVLGISNGWLKFDAKKGKTATPQNISVAVDYLTAPLAWSASSDATWLSVSPASGTLTPAASSSPVVVSVNAAGLGVGSYTGYITASAPGAIGDGSKITVNLQVVSSSKIVVTTNRSDAKFTVSGPASYSGTGSNWSTEDAPAGDYTVNFESVSGFKKPAALSKSLVADGETSFNGVYVSYKELAAKKNIVVAKGPAVANDSTVRIFKNSDAVADIKALATTYGAYVAVGDIDADGSAEIIAGAGDGPNNPATVRIYGTDRKMKLEFVPFGTMGGVRVAAADLNGDGKAELIAATAGGTETVSKVAVYEYDASSVTMVPTGIEFAAFDLPMGANVAVADLDGNGKPYLVTAPGFARENAAEVKVWKVDASKGLGNWSVSQAKDFFLGNAYGATVAAADVDGDGADEIIAGTGGMANGAAGTVSIIKANGSMTSFKAFDRYGVNVAAADLDGDGKAEIIAAAGRGDGSGTRSSKMVERPNTGSENGNVGASDSEAGAIRVMNGAGTVKFVLRPFDDVKEGVNVTVGDLGL